MHYRSLSLLLALAGLADAGDFIRQIQNMGGATIISDIPVAAASGQVQSQALTADSAIFQLYATEAGPNNTQTLKKLDEKTVGTYLPVAQVQALSEDPYFPARTRADRPYGIRLTIHGIPAAAPGQALPQPVKVFRGYRLYDPTTYLDAGTGGNYADTFTFGNGEFTAGGILPQLPGERPTKACGEESFTAFLYSEGSSQASELAKATIQIWPVAEAQITVLEDGKVYRALPPHGSIVIRDMYPKSITYAQIYPGPKVTGTSGTPLPSTVVSHDTYLPQNANLALTDLDHMLEEDGQYTLEVLTITPFNGGAPELLTSVSFWIKRSISINGMISTIE